MPEVIFPSFAKLNLSLRVLGQRPDGFHEIFTVFQTISLHDDIAFELSSETRLECDNDMIPTGKDNLVLRAVEALRQRTGTSKGVTVRLKKRIPSPGGLGGGSSNAAVSLLAVSGLWGLDLSKRELVEIGSELGSDVPFFIYGGTAVGTGRGTSVEPVEDFVCSNIVVVSPDADISTPKAYSALGFGDLTKKNAKSILEHYRAGVGSLYKGRFEFVNDFESFVFDKYPEVAAAADKLRKAGARIVSLSGSGPSLFGIFDDKGKSEGALRDLEGKGINRCFAVTTVSRGDYFERLGMS